MKRISLLIVGTAGLFFLLRPAYFAFIFNPEKNIDACGALWNGKPRSEIEANQTIFSDDGMLFLVDYCGKETRTYLDFEGFPFKAKLKKYWIQFHPKASIIDVKKVAHHYGLDSVTVASMDEGGAIENEKVQLFKDVNGEFILSFKKIR